MNIDQNLLGDGTEEKLHSEHGGPIGVRGSYNRLDFVVRLRGDLAKHLESSDPTQRFKPLDSWEAAMAFSTYVHENIHWWQHAGTTTGLMLSFIQPAHAHLNRSKLDEIIKRRGAIKPLKRLYLQLVNDEGMDPDEDRDLNYVLNNWHDLEFFRQLVLSPHHQVHVVAEDHFFESVGHCYAVAIECTSWMICATVDQNRETLTSTEAWEEERLRLKEQKFEGFYHGSRIEVPPLGAMDIFEGQARFSQLQYLYGVSDRQYGWDEAKRGGMLHGIYVSAFDIFLANTEQEWPTDVDSPLVGLFLLICELALSPAEGLLTEMADVRLLVESTDPGWRFLFLCTAAKQHPEVLTAIREYSPDEYWQVSELLSQEIDSPSPRHVAELIEKWSHNHAGWASLVSEDKTFDFSEGNLPIRVLLSRFSKIHRDRLRVPHFFCWSGMCLNNLRQSMSVGEALELLEEHASLFVDRVDRDVYPRLLPGRSGEALQTLFDDFYAWVAMYEMTRQWIVEDGAFEYDYLWLTSKHSQDDIKAWAAERLQNACGVHPDNFKVL